MRVVQFQILKKILEKFEMPDYIHAFETGKSIPSMASNHIGQSLVISIDLKDYFPSIKQVHVRAAFEALGLTGSAATVASELCTFGNFLPQGAITSPKLSNIVTALTFGPTLKEYCDSQGAVLTIFADDITISISDYAPSFIGNTINYVRALVKSQGFRINEDKTKVMTSRARQYVCGVVVNEKPNLMKRERERLRSIVHNCKMNGFEAEALKSGLSVDAFYSKIYGKLNWYYQLNPIRATPLIEELKLYKSLTTASPETPALPAPPAASTTSSEIAVPW